MDLLAWVMKNNYIQFSDSYFLQIKGAAMGTPVAVVFAVIYLLQLEKKLMESIPDINKPLLYARYIDDIFAIFRNAVDAKSFMDKINDLHPSISFTFEIANKVDFLDLTLSIKKHPMHYCSISTSLYQKPINKYLYLLPFSFHLPHIFANFILSELNRYRLVCSDEEDFLNKKSAFHHRLQERGFTASYLLNIFSIPLNRSDLLVKNELTYQSLTKPPQNNPSPLILKIINTPRTLKLDLGRCLRVPDFVKTSKISVDIFDRIIICNCTSKNIEQLLISSKLSTPVADDFFTK
jgi:hypothetical protein